MGEDALVLRIDALGNRVGGIARRPGRKTVFVRGALPGEVVACLPVAEKRGYIEAELLEVREPSPHRVPPPCPSYGWCGGCSLQHLDYRRQLHWKRSWVSNALERRGIGGATVEEVIASPMAMAYRNRVTFQLVGGRPGLHAFRGDARPVDGCPLLDHRGRALLEWFSDSGITGCRRITARASRGTGSLRLELHDLPTQASLPKPPDGSSLAWSRDGRWQSSGPEFTERLAGVQLLVPPGGFIQVNTAAAELLVGVVGDLCGRGRVLDLYGGVGSIGLALATQGSRVVSVERNPEASRCGVEAAERQGIGDIEFLASRARSYLVKALRNGVTFDAVVADPPRAGMGIRTARLLRRLRPASMVMVGCDPYTMARDMAILLEGGYSLHRVVPLDLFPQTDHVETIALLALDEADRPTAGTEERQAL